jgi:hypothetical protein
MRLQLVPPKLQTFGFVSDERPFVAGAALQVDGGVVM